MKKFIVSLFLLLTFVVILVACGWTKTTENTDSSNNAKDKSDMSDLEIKIVYKGSAYMGIWRGKAICEVYKKSNDAALTYEFSEYGIRNEYGKIKIEEGGYGKFECNNGNCNYDILINDSTLTITGYDWGCNLRKQNK